MNHFTQLICHSLRGSDEIGYGFLEVEQPPASIALTYNVGSNRYIKDPLQHVIVQRFGDPIPLVSSFIRNPLVDTTKSLTSRGQVTLCPCG